MARLSHLPRVAVSPAEQITRDVHEHLSEKSSQSAFHASIRNFEFIGSIKCKVNFKLK